MTCSTAIRAVVLATALGFCLPATAEDIPAGDAADVPVRTTVPAQRTGPDRTAVPDIANGVEHLDIIVENQPLSVRSRRTDTDGVLIEASPVFAQLTGKASVEGTVLSYHRSQDGAVLTLDFADGKVRANGLVLGILPEFEPKSAASTWLSVNAISVLTGTVAAADSSGIWAFTLDDRLRPQFDLDLYVNGKQIDDFRAEPRTIGPVLLVPLESVINELGHSLERDGNVLSVRRIQDAARLTLDLSTGLITVNGTPRGVTPNIAYIDPVNLLLPFTAVETLTGTHITLAPGSNRIDVVLDDRLAGGALPGERVVDEAQATGFTPESLDFQVSDRGPVITSFDSRFRDYNSTFRYESVGGVGSAEELTPGWVSLDVRSLDGWVGSAGDANTRFRELSGVDQTRIRGATYRRQSETDGTLLAIAAGIPISGSEVVSTNVSRPTFSGFAGGARLISGDGTREIGLSGALAENGGDNRVVFSLQREVNRSDSETGLKGVFLSGDLGVFDGPRGTDVDARARVQARYKLSEEIGFNATASYDGARFNQGGGLAQTPDFEGVLSDGLGSRFVGTVSTDWRSFRDWGPVSGVSAGARAAYTRSGGDNGNESIAGGASVRGRVASLGIDVTVDADISRQTAMTGEASTTNGVNVRAFKRFGWGAAQATYSTITTDGITDQRLVSNIQVNPVRRNLGRGATVSAGPSASVVWTPNAIFARLGATLSANSGQAFGTRLNVQGQVSALQSVDPENSQTGFLAGLAATYDLTRSLRLEANYFDNLQGERNVSVALRGRVTFNDPRKHTRPRDGLGVLQGKVFLDRNRDGIRQPDEPGLPGVRVQVTGTRLGLGVDRSGNFTIQNMKEGLYGLVVDRRSLPLGLLVPEASAARVTIGEGRLTEIEIPVIASGQIRGALFIDANGSGEADPGETRLEGALVSLKKAGAPDEAPVIALAATFGQYSFENLTPGDYEISTNHGGEIFSRTVTLTETGLFVVVPFGLPSGTDGPGREPFAAEIIGEA